MSRIKVRNDLLFERHEKKYRLDEEKAAQVWSILSDHMQPDPFGPCSIGSIYYDTDTYCLIRRSIEHPEYREKLRLRCYGFPGDEDIVFLELKKKLKGVSHKKRKAMTLAEARNCLDLQWLEGHNEQLLGEIGWILQRYSLAPKVLIYYDRQALVLPDEGLRITIDRNIRWRTHSLDFAQGDAGTLLLPSDSCLIEVKVDGRFPFWLSRLLSENQLYPTPFSKYGMIYKNELHSMLWQRPQVCAKQLK